MPARGSAAEVPTQYPNFRVEPDGYVTTVTIDRPDAKNACTGDMWVALGAIFREVAFSGARAVLLTGAGGEFCAGADLGGASNGAGEGGSDAGPPASQLDSLRVLAE